MIRSASAIVLVMLVVVEALWAVGVLNRADAAVADVWHSLYEGRASGAPVVLGAIDDETLQKLEDPLLFWGPHLAKAIETARDGGATTIGLDVLTRVSGEDFFRDHDMQDLPVSRTWDASFRRNLFQGDVVLVAQRTSGDQADRLELPLGEYLLMVQDARSRLGFDNLPFDDDGVVRRWRPVVAHELADEPKAPVHAFSMALALHHRQQEATGRSWRLAGRSIELNDAFQRIVFQHPPGAFPRIPFWKLVQPEALTEEERRLLEGAVVVIGATHTGSTDRLRTPFADALMPGVEVHANAVATLLTGERLISVNRLLRVLSFAVLGGLFAWLLLRRRARTGIIVTGGLLGALPVVGYGAFVVGVLLPVVSFAVLVVGIFGGVFLYRYVGESAERRRLRALFGRYVSDAVVDDILASEDGVRLGGERRLVTVLFSDIRNFTTLSEELDPEEVVEMLNAWFELACRPIIEEGGVVDKFIGDAVMAVFGAPLSMDDHSDRALRAAIRLSSAADSFAGWMETRFAGRGLPPFDVGVGVHTGPAVVGNIGFEQRTEYTAIGDAVNVASRLEGLTKEHGCRILASGDTLAETQGAYERGRTTEVQVKGRSEPVHVIEIGVPRV